MYTSHTERAKEMIRRPRLTEKMSLAAIIQLLNRKNMHITLHRKPALPSTCIFRIMLIRLRRFISCNSSSFSGLLRYCEWRFRVSCAR